MKNGVMNMAKEKEKNELWEWLKALIIAFIIMIVVRTFLFSPVLVDGASMEPTLYENERLIVNKLGKPKRFDIVVFHATQYEDHIKRVIGLPGDHIAFKDDTLYINGEPYDEPYLETYKEQYIGDNYTNSFTLENTPVNGEVVPDDHYFVMGDNRNDSFDSRDSGAIHKKEIVGKVKIVYFPFKSIRTIKQ